MSFDTMSVANGGVQSVPFNNLQPGNDDAAQMEEEYRPLIEKGASKKCLICEGVDYKYRDKSSEGQVGTPRWDILQLVRRYSSSGNVEMVIDMVKRMYKAIKENVVIEKEKGEVTPAPKWSAQSISDHFYGRHGTQTGVDPLNFALNHVVAGAQAAQESLRCSDGSINKMAAEIHINYLKTMIGVQQAIVRRDREQKADRPVSRVKSSLSQFKRRKAFP